MFKSVIKDKGLIRHLGGEVWTWPTEEEDRRVIKGTLIKTGSDNASFAIDTGGEEYPLIKGCRVCIWYKPKPGGRRRYTRRMHIYE